MKKLSMVLAVVVWLVPTELAADECIASEEFASASTLLFGPDNVTRDRLSAASSSPHPFDACLELLPDVTVHSTDLTLGPTDRGSLEDVVWVELGSFEETYPGRVQGFTVVAFTGGGPEVRILRTSSRPEATLQWFDGTTWNPTGTVIRLDRRYRLRTVMYLDSGTMDVYLREEGHESELALTLGASFRAFSDVTVKRRLSLGRPTKMKVSLAAWQLWRVGRSELLRLSSSSQEVPGGEADVVMRYAASVVLDGDATQRTSGVGTMTYTLRSARGVCDDMELTDISRWYPTARVQRQTSFRRSGQWSLGIAEGPRPVDTEVTLPHGDFKLRLHFLVPKELPANRQVYLVRFKSPETGAEPVGPSVYLDYGAAGAGKSFIICQLNPEVYYAEEVTVEPGRWYGLRLVSQRARSAYTAWFIDDQGVEKPINEGKPLSFFLGTDIGDQVQWRFFSIVSMRPGVTDWPKIDLVPRTRRVTVSCPEKDRKLLQGLQLRGLPAERAKDLDLNDPDAVQKALSNYRQVIDKNWPSFTLTQADAEKLKDYVAFEILGNVYMPWQPVDFAYNTNGTMRLTTNYVPYVPTTPTAVGEFRTWTQAGEKPRLIGQGPLYFYMLYIPPKDSSERRAEVRWIHPHGPAGKPLPIPTELITGEDVTLDHPGAPYPLTAATVVDGKCYITLPYVGLAVYDGDWLRQRYGPNRFEKIAGSRYYMVGGFTWDPWAECFWLNSTARHLMKLDRDLNPLDKERVYFSTETVAMTAGPEDLYFITKEGAVLRYNKFLSARGVIPMEKMFGGVPLFSAVACVDHFLYLGTRRDSPIYPSHVICIDTTTWNPLFNVDLTETFPDVTAMAADGETMHLFDRGSPRVMTFKLPPRHELAPQKTFVYIDDVELTALKIAEDIRLLPDPSGGTAGWEPVNGMVKNPSGEGWVLRQNRGAVVYERSNIAYVGKEQSQYGWLKLHTLEPRSDSGMLNVDVRTAETPYVRRVAVFYTRGERLIRAAPELYGRNYTVEEFFAEKGLSPWHYHFRWWARHLEGPVEDVYLRKIRMLPAGKGYHEHVFSLEKDLDIKPGETINGILLSHWRETPPVLSVTLSPSEWTAPEEVSGVVTSLPVLLEEGARRLDWLSWEGVPFDPARGRLTMEVRTAGGKYFIDRVPWTPIDNRRRLGLPLERYVQWRLRMSTKDVWRPPGVSRLLFGLSRREVPVEAVHEPTGGRRLWLLLIVPAAAAFAYFIIGRKTWWERKRRA